MKRVLLSAAALLAAAMILCGTGRAQAAGEWRLVQKNYSYELAAKAAGKTITFFETVDRAAKDGFKYMEVKPAQKIGGGIDGDMNLAKMDKATMDKVLAKCKEAGIEIVGFGVARASGEAEVKAMFENCKAAGVQYIVMEPKTEELELLDKLAQQYQIPIAIHNHPISDKAPYWSPESVLKVCEGRSKMIGACADTGHWLRSNLDPIECLKKFEGRIIMLHFKDVVPDDPADKPTPGTGPRNIKCHDVAWGEGDCNALGMLAELKRQGFKGDFSIEYEHGATLDENIPKIIKFFNENKDKTQAELEAAAKK